MPKAEISDAYGIAIKLEANEASAEALGEKALELYAAAVAITDQRPPGPAGGVQAERRGTSTHTDPNHSSNFGFAPVKAEMGDGQP